jgi:hypothetical protein
VGGHEHPSAGTPQGKPKTVVRQLRGDAHGDYTTKGRYGSAAVSGTIWLTQDRCDGTYVRVTKDNVIVVAYAHPHRRHNIRHGHHIRPRSRLLIRPASPWRAPGDLGAMAPSAPPTSYGSRS